MTSSSSASSQPGLQTQTAAPETLERVVPTFLSLAPATSASYPQPKKAQPAGEQKRRTSSTSSDGSKHRILKLGPVHWGQHLDDHEEDWHEVAIV